jgi:hypothetical protein
MQGSSSRVTDSHSFIGKLLTIIAKRNGPYNEVCETRFVKKVASGLKTVNRSHVMGDEYKERLSLDSNRVEWW